MTDYQTKDSGKRMEFETGSKRDTQEGKTRPDLIGPELLERLGSLMARGAEKYGENNWRLGQLASRYYASMFRHMLQWAQGDDTEDHLAAVAFNVGGLMHLEAKMPERLDHERYEKAREAERTEIVKSLGTTNHNGQVCEIKPISEYLRERREKVIPTQVHGGQGYGIDYSVAASHESRSYCAECKKWHDHDVDYCGYLKNPTNRLPF